MYAKKGPPPDLALGLVFGNAAQRARLGSAREDRRMCERCSADLRAQNLKNFDFGPSLNAVATVKMQRSLAANSQISGNKKDLSGNPVWT